MKAMKGSLTNRFLAVSALGLIALTAGAFAFGLGQPGGVTDRMVMAELDQPTSQGTAYRFDLAAMDFFPVALLPAGEREPRILSADVDPATTLAVLQPLVLHTGGPAETPCSHKLLRLAEVETGGSRYGIILAPEDRPSAIGGDMRLFPAGKVLARAPGMPALTVICRNPSV